ncbi:unnamed protein product [Spirodela intermedia]|uniref:Uncharacterized protein n=1 Tax=Spirodela intermedia TaxID=51605 RepID=A0A7I8KTP0_SPIIN|nr:unnamed protein product [Spirodela intermedia]
MGRRVVSGGCHPAEWKNDDFAAFWRLSPNGKELDGGGARPLLAATPRLSFRPACGPGWPAGPPIL